MTSPTTLAAPTTVSTDIALPVLLVIKEKQLYNGLRNGNYLRYRNYCSTKLRKLRKKLNLMHQLKGKKQPFLKREIPNVKSYFQPAATTTPQTPTTTESTVITTTPIVYEPVKTTNLLSLILFQAERAWAFAMQLKQEIAEKDDAQKKYHNLKRLAKAAKYSAQLEAFCAEVADKRTVFEAEAYNSWMTGNLKLAKEEWTEAQKHFTKARTIYEQLSQVGKVAAKEAYKARVEEIDPSIRFCVFSANRNNKDANFDIASMIDSSENYALDPLKASLADVLEEIRKNQAKTMDEIEWNGKRIVIESEKLRVCLVNAEALKHEITTVNSADAKMRIYDKLFILLSDSQKLIRDDLKANPKKDDQKYLSNMRMLLSYLSQLQLERTLDRNLLLVGSMIDKLLDEEKDKKKDKKKSTTPVDVVRLYEVILQNIGDLQQMPGVEENDKLVKELNAKAAAYKAHRCYYLAKEYTSQGQWKESLALFDRAETLVNAAKKELAVFKLNQEITGMDQIVKSIRQAKCVSKAQFILSKAKQNQDDDVFETRSNATQQQGAESEQGKVEVLARLDSFQVERKGKPFLVNFPPNFESIPAKPIFFDVANNNIKYPDLKSKLAAEKKGGWFSFWK